MKNSVYSTFDFVTELFSQPWVSPNDKCALRAFAFAVNDPDFIICKSPQDYALFKIAEFDDHTGELTPVNPKIVSKAIDLFKEKIVSAIKKYGKDNVSVVIHGEECNSNIGDRAENMGVVREDDSKSFGCKSDENQGAAVGGESPLKQQSVNHGVLEADASEKTTACESSKTSSSKSKKSRKKKSKIICNE